MKILIEVDEQDYKKLQRTEMTIDDMFNTTQGRIYGAVVNGEVQYEVACLNCGKEMK